MQADGPSETETSSSFFGRSEKKSKSSAAAAAEVSVISNDGDSEVSQPGTEEIKGAMKVSIIERKKKKKQDQVWS